MEARSKAGWAGWIAGPLGWFVHQQVGSTTNYWDCSVGRPWLVIGLGLACALIVVTGGAVSWRGLRRAGRADGGGNGRFIAIMGLTGGRHLPGCGDRADDGGPCLYRVRAVRRWSLPVAMLPLLWAEPALAHEISGELPADPGCPCRCC